MSRTLEAYLQLRYPIELIREEDGGYFAQHPDLEGCATQGETADEAVSNLDAARELWIRSRLEDGLPIPDPPVEEPSGKFLLRMPRWLHGRLARLAEREGVSLNQLINTVLARYAGGQEATSAAEAARVTVEQFLRCLWPWPERRWKSTIDTAELHHTNLFVAEPHMLLTCDYSALAPFMETKWWSCDRRLKDTVARPFEAGNRVSEAQASAVVKA
jgi:predicted RNase H-like HicB family nuclease